jgi:murein DD-endopeptidase MepM/ murein hydrolase activator NlpD
VCLPMGTCSYAVVAIALTAMVVLSTSLKPVFAHSDEPATVDEPAWSDEPDSMPVEVVQFEETTLDQPMTSALLPREDTQTEPMVPLPVPTPTANLTTTPAPTAILTTTSTPWPTAAPFEPPTEPEPGMSVIRLFNKPFVGEFVTANVVDHKFPLQFQDNDTPGQELAFWGRLTAGYDSHEGYDWLLPEGTPLLAVAEGTVNFAGEGGSFYCPTLSRNVTGLYVYIRHADQQIALESHYAHLSRVDVANGASVMQGQLVGLSGNTGCSAVPHLHYAVYRQVGARWTPIDPYGWSGSTPDPWASHPLGAQSVWLWNSGQTPRLFRAWGW